jgi:lipoate-protein ligase B
MEFKIFDLGLVDYFYTWQRQKEIFNDVKIGLLESGLILCQHYPVITLGRQAKKENLRVDTTELRSRGIGIYEIKRGGDVTYHGPGQLVAYPIFNLNYFKKDIHLFLRQLEEAVINLLADFGIQGLRYTGLTGVWVEQQKIASIGIAIKNWITFHGLSINIKKDDLENFRLIRPCGMNIKMTSLESVLGRDVEINSIKETLIPKFRDVFEANRETRETFSESIGRVSP